MKFNVFNNSSDKFFTFNLQPGNDTGVAIKNLNPLNIKEVIIFENHSLFATSTKTTKLITILLVHLHYYFN